MCDALSSGRRAFARCQSSSGTEIDVFIRYSAPLVVSVFLPRSSTTIGYEWSRPSPQGQSGPGDAMARERDSEQPVDLPPAIGPPRSPDVRTASSLWPAQPSPAVMVRSLAPRGRSSPRLRTHRSHTSCTALRSEGIARFHSSTCGSRRSDTHNRGKAAVAHTAGQLPTDTQGHVAVEGAHRRNCMERRSGPVLPRPAHGRRPPADTALPRAEPKGFAKSPPRCPYRYRQPCSASELEKGAL
jgi:hypothetical protein